MRSKSTLRRWSHQRSESWKPTLHCVSTRSCRESLSLVGHWSLLSLVGHWSRSVCIGYNIMQWEIYVHTLLSIWMHWSSGGLSNWRPRPHKFSAHWSTASNPEEAANLLCARANSASYPQWDGKWVVAYLWGEGLVWLVVVVVCLLAAPPVSVCCGTISSRQSAATF